MAITGATPRTAMRFIDDVQLTPVPGMAVLCCRCRFVTAHFHGDDARQWLGQPLPVSVQAAVVSRQAEFVAGRYVAHCALQAIGAAPNVPIGPRREPVWPLGVVASLSHTADEAVCVVATDPHVESLGVDLEVIISPDTCATLLSSVLVAEEYHWVGSAQAPDPVAFTLIFSVKESLYKALYPQLLQVLDFAVAKVTNINWALGTIRLELCQTVSDAMAKGSVFDGCFKISGGKVFTLVYRERADVRSL